MIHFHFFNYPLLIQVAIVIILLALLIIVMTLLIIIFQRITAKIYKKKSDLAQNLILDELNKHILRYDSIEEMSKDELEETINRLNLLKNENNVSRKVLLKILLYFRLNLLGGITKIINLTYTKLNLSDFTLTKLQSSSWLKKAEGLKELQQMDGQQFIPEISKLQNDKNIDVRVEAYTALIKLNPVNPFEFLRLEKSELSEWHQILLFDSVTEINTLSIPSFKNYLRTTNHSIVLFCIKLILHYKQFDASHELISLLDHEDEQVRYQTIYALGYLNVQEANQKLMQIYPNECSRNKSQILLALGEIASTEGIDFIEDKFIHTSQYSILMNATRALVAHSKDLRSKALVAESFILDEGQKAAIKHFKDPLIKLYGNY